MFKKQAIFYLASIISVLLIFGFFSYKAKAAYVPTVGDNLGDHTAIQNILLNNNWLSGDGGNEGIFVNANGNVGVGLTNPLQRLQVDGIVRSSNGFCIGTSCATTWDAFVLPTGTNNYTLRHNGTTWIANANLYNDGTNIGVGTTAPAQRIHTTGSVRADSSFCIGASCVSTWDAFVLPAGSSGGTLRHNGTTWINNTNLYNNGTNVGVGLTNPLQKLHVSGSVRATGFCIGTDCLSSWPTFTSNDDVIGNEILNVTNTTLTRSGSGTAVSPYTVALNLGNANTWTAVQTFNANTLFPGTSILNTSGNLGVGTTAPAQRIHTTGSVRADSSFCIGASCVSTWDAFVLPAGSSGGTLRHNGTTWINNTNLYNNGTNVGVGLTNPLQKLHVSGSVRATGFCIGTDCLSSWPTSSSGTVTSVGSGTGLTGGPITTSGTLSLTGQALALHNLGTNGLITRTSSGVVAARTITVSGNGISISNGNGVSGNPAITLSNNVTGSGTSNYISKWNGTNSQTNSIIYDNGVNVGIGTVSPVQKLQVDGYVRGNDGLCIGTDCRTTWPAAGGTGTVTSVGSGTGLTGGPITTSGTLSLTGQALALHNLGTNGLITRTSSGVVAARTITAGTGISVSNGNGVSGNPRIDANIGTGSTQVAAGNHSHAINTLSANTHRMFYSNSSGAIIELSHGSSGQVLTSSGATGAPYWNTISTGSGTVTRVDSGTGLTGGPITTSGTLSLDTNSIFVRADSTTNPAAVRYTGTTQTSGYFYGGSTTPTNSTYTLNFSGIFRATQLCIGSTCKTAWPADSNDNVIGNEILNVTDTTLTRSGDGNVFSPYTVALNLANSNTWTGTQTFNAASTRFANGSAGSPSITFSLDTDTGIYRATTNTLGFSTFGLERMRINSAGNVGIGLTNPAQKLAVNGYIRVEAGNGFCIGTSCITSWPSGSSLPTGTTHGTLRYDGSNWVNSTNIYNNGTNVGIGLTNPTQKLAVNGAVHAGGSSGMAFMIGNDAYLEDINSTNTVRLTGNSNNTLGGLYIGGNNQNLITASGNSYFNGTGNVGVGTNSPSQKLHVNGNMLTNRVYLMDVNHSIRAQSGVGLVFATYGVGDVMVLRQDTGRLGIGMTNPSYRLDVNGTVRAVEFIYTSSDSRLKENIKTIINPLDKVTALRGVTFDWKNSNSSSLGLIAQEVENIFPEIVSTDDEGFKSIQYSSLVAPLIEAVKEQQKQISSLESRIQKLENSANKK